MIFIVKHLIFQSNAGFSIGVVALFHKILNSAVGSFGQFEFKLQVKGAILLFCDDISAGALLSACGLANGKHPVLHTPSLFGKGLLVKSSPVIRCFAIPQQRIALYPFLSRKMIGNQVHDKSVVIRTGIKLFRLNTDISPADLLAHFSLTANAVHLQSYKSFSSHLISQTRRRNAIHPRSDGIANSLYPIMIPLILFIGTLCFWIKDQGIDPPSSCLIVNSSAPRPLRRINLNLVTVNTTIHIVSVTQAAYLDTRIHTTIIFEFQL